jgi:hypothetical protein
VTDPRPLITARCAHCHKVAAKYWRHGDEGRWFGLGLGAIACQIRRAPNRSAELDELNAEAVRLLQWSAEWELSAALMTLGRMDGFCSCEPPPALPDGAELAALVARAEAKSQPVGDHWRTPLTIRVR